MERKTDKAEVLISNQGEGNNDGRIGPLGAKRLLGTKKKKKKRWLTVLCPTFDSTTAS